MMRSVLAIAAGVFTLGVLAIGGDAVFLRLVPGAFDARGFTDRPGVLLVMIVYTTAFSAISGWVTARVSRRADRRDVLILAAIQLAMTVAASAVLFDVRLLWFYAATIVATPAAIVFGGSRGALVPRSPETAVGH
jgi:hypothetical protein